MMHLKFLTALLPILLPISVLAGTQTASPTSGTPSVTYPTDGAFVFCSAQDCTGTCEVVDVSTVPRDDGEAAPNDMGFQSIYWYDPGNYNWVLYTCVDYYDCDAVGIGPGVCYDLYEDGVPTDFYEYWYVVG